ncbi:hypothetical protein LAZ67_9002243 [Cordylochernes scorpioides]|uniref:Transposase n=1 Tax=Cordylochernes scorpioides TaxID=51811 RepID=A0ABY6KYM5_9ARAC|nr:hypothetical protein LAZ67_9002243 [Cordylochernes scorpioides]
MTAQRYVDDVLRPVTLPYLQGVPNALYQQDNARPHTARISQQALQDVQMLPWPPYSPDLSPIEHREWRAITQDAIRTLIDSLPRRVAACIAVRGGFQDLLPPQLASIQASHPSRRCFLDLSSFLPPVMTPPLPDPRIPCDDPWPPIPRPLNYDLYIFRFMPAFFLPTPAITSSAQHQPSPENSTPAGIIHLKAYDRKMDGALVTTPQKLLRLPRYLTRQSLELFRKLRLATQTYFQVRQTLLDLYPESNEASFAKYFALKLAGQAGLEEYYRGKTALGMQLGLPQEVILETLTRDCRSPTSALFGWYFLRAWECGTNWCNESAEPANQLRVTTRNKRPICRVHTPAHQGKQVRGLHLHRRRTANSAAPITGTLSAATNPLHTRARGRHRKRRQFKQTDAFTRGMVIGLKRAGWSIRQIAADTHLGASTVHRLWRRWLEQGNVAIYRNVGATRVTSAPVDRRILRQAVAAPQATCTAILQHVHAHIDHSISTRTISRRLVANGLHSCRPLRRLPLTPPNRRQRLEWCRARSTWMTERHRVVFSDESRFCLSSDSRRVRVWRRRGERSNPAAIVERPTVRQRGIMVWGAIAYGSRSPLLRIQGTMTAQRYVDDQDNARPHTARISQQAPQDVQMLPWPPYSPDLSPIEHFWDIIGRRLHALPQPRSEDELWQMVEREWRAIPQDAIRTLIDSLPRRVAACIAVRGGPTCY